MIHPTAIIHPKAQIGAGCEIGPFSIVGEHVALGDKCKLHSHSVIDGHTRLGQGNEIFPFAALGMKTQDLKYKGGNPRLEIGDHNVFREGVTVHCATNDGEATVIGSHNLFLIQAHVAHDCILGNHIIMSGYAGLAGHCVVEDHAVFAGYVAVHQFCRIGKLSMIGGCSKIVQDVPPFMIVDGNPGETRTINKVGLERHGVGDAAQSALKLAYKILFREGLTISNALTKIESELPALPEIKHLIQFIRASERGISK
ncbi:MAG TPA: acyl-ACP--UDP-N-acetylglucosamine O-acyltransferase [Verrucomicrobiae bacterium]|jgi:UDP-N-acetylglucosamine acyltransferase|nr:acyl-ACP--UDP-N-acetylglucosamine O-acyltransferase [Verrucomicrobiae bacterium]